MAELAPLVCRPQPYSDESLSSYVLRLQVANGYEALGWLTGWLRGQIKPSLLRRFTAIDQIIWLENLATATTVPVADLHRMTLNRYLPQFTLPGRTLDYQSVSSGEQFAFYQPNHKVTRWSRAETATTFCPQCLRETPYHQLPWLLYPVFACPKHNCWLLDTCTHCGARVSISAILKGQCKQCAAVLADMLTPTLDTTVAEVQQQLMACLETDVFFLDTRLPLSMPVLFRFLEGLCAVMCPLGWDWEGAYRPTGVMQDPFSPRPQHGLSPVQYGSLYTRAWLAIRDWPQGFHTFLDQYTQHCGGDQLGLKRRLGSLHVTWLERHWQHPDFEPVQTAFNDYFVTRFPPVLQLRLLSRIQRYPELQAQMPLIGVKNAGELLGVSSSTVTRLVRDGYVRAYHPPGKPAQGGYFVYREDLENGWQQRSSLMPLNHVAREFFTCEPTIVEWIEAGLIQQTGTHLVNGVPQPCFTRQDVDRFLGQLAEQVSLVSERPSYALTFTNVCIRNVTIGITITRLLQRVLAGKLRAYHTDPHLQPFSQLWFHPDDATSLTEQIKAENNWITLREIPSFLQVDRKAVRFWVHQQWLVPVTALSRSVYFDRDEVGTFRQRILRFPEVMSLLETTETALRPWIAAGYLPLLSNPHKQQGKSYLFDRDAVHQWHVQYVTPTEAQRILGVSQYKAFRKRIVMGCYPSPVPDDVVSKFYYRTVLEQFQAELEQ